MEFGINYNENYIANLQEQINNAYKKVDSTGEITADINNELTSLQNRVDTKLTQYSNLLDMMELQLRELDNQKATIDGKKTLIRDGMKTIIAKLMEECPDGVKTNNYNLYYTHTQSYELGENVDLKELQVNFPNMVRTKLEFNKIKAREYFKDTELLPDGVIRKENKNLQFKLRSGE